MKRALLIATLLALLLVSISFAMGILQELGDVRMSVHGWIAMGLGIFFSLLLGGGLMMLSFHSARKGYDDAAHDDKSSQE